MTYTKKELYIKLLEHQREEKTVRDKPPIVPQASTSIHNKRFVFDESAFNRLFGLIDDIEDTTTDPTFNEDKFNNIFGIE